MWALIHSYRKISQNAQISKNAFKKSGQRSRRAGHIIYIKSEILFANLKILPLGAACLLPDISARSVVTQNLKARYLPAPDIKCYVII